MQVWYAARSGLGSGWCKSTARPSKPPEAKKAIRPKVEIMVALRSISTLHHWLDPGKGITELAGPQKERRPCERLSCFAFDGVNFQRRK
jgi:hypothetical protein